MEGEGGEVVEKQDGQVLSSNLIKPSVKEILQKNNLNLKQQNERLFMQMRESVFQKFIQSRYGPCASCTPSVVDNLVKDLDPCQRELELVALWNYFVTKGRSIDVIEHVTKMLELDQEELEKAANEICECQPLMTAWFCRTFFDDEFAEEKLTGLIQGKERDPFHEEDHILRTLRGQQRSIRWRMDSKKKELLNPAF